MKGELVPVAFSTWCPIAIAGIGGQRDTLMSRSVIISLRRKLADETVERLPFDLHRQLHRIRRQAARWAADNALRIAAMELEPPACGNDRLQDNFTPLTRIAAALGGAWPDRIATAYAAKAQVRDDENEATNIMLLRDVWSLFERNPHHRTRSSSELVEHLVGMDDRPWPEYRHGRPLTASTIARLLRPFEIKSSNIRTGMSVVKGYYRDDVKAAFDRYAATPAFQPLRRYTPENKQENGNSSRYKAAECSGIEPEINEQNQSCSGVAAENADQSASDDPYNPDNWT
jgi:putative DNA primase/helicase